METRDNRYDNMGPRLDLGPAPPLPPRRRPEPPPGQSPQPPADKDQAAAPPRTLAQTAPAPDRSYAPERADNFSSAPEEQERFWREADFYDQAKDQAQAGSAPGGIMLAQPRPGRWLSWAALTLAAAALAFSLFNGKIQTVSQETIDRETVPGATAERVAKLEKDISSLMLKTVTLEKDLEAIKNRSWSPARLNEISSRLNALQAQVDALPAAANPAPARNAAVPAGAGTSREDRAGARPAPAAANPGGGQDRAAAPRGQPRAAYTVQRGDTLFSVAQRYQVTTRDLLEWNQMKPEDTLPTGKTLVIY
jgi:outer membrane murein-binding lipoprotein Lpp